MRFLSINNCAILLVLSNDFGGVGGSSLGDDFAGAVQAIGGVDTTSGGGGGSPLPAAAAVEDRPHTDDLRVEKLRLLRKPGEGMKLYEISDLIKEYNRRAVLPKEDKDSLNKEGDPYKLTLFTVLCQISTGRTDLTEDNVCLKLEGKMKMDHAKKVLGKLLRLAHPEETATEKLHRKEWETKLSGFTPPGTDEERTAWLQALKAERGKENDPSVLKMMKAYKRKLKKSASPGRDVMDLNRQAGLKSYFETGLATDFNAPNHAAKKGKYLSKMALGKLKDGELDLVNQRLRDQLRAQLRITPSEAEQATIVDLDRKIEAVSSLSIEAVVEALGGSDVRTVEGEHPNVTAKRNEYKQLLEVQKNRLVRVGEATQAGRTHRENSAGGFEEIGRRLVSDAETRDAMRTLSVLRRQVTHDTSDLDQLRQQVITFGIPATDDGRVVDLQQTIIREITAARVHRAGVAFEEAFRPLNPTDEEVRDMPANDLNERIEAIAAIPRADVREELVATRDHRVEELRAILANKRLEAAGVPPVVDDEVGSSELIEFGTSVGNSGEEEEGVSKETKRVNLFNRIDGSMNTDTLATINSNIRILNHVKVARDSQATQNLRRDVLARLQTRRDLLFANEWRSLVPADIDGATAAQLRAAVASIHAVNSENVSVHATAERHSVEQRLIDRALALETEIARLADIETRFASTHDLGTLRREVDSVAFDPPNSDVTQARQRVLDAITAEEEARRAAVARVDAGHGEELGGGSPPPRVDVDDDAAAARAATEADARLTPLFNRVRTPDLGSMDLEQLRQLKGEIEGITNGSVATRADRDTEITLLEQLISLKEKIAGIGLLNNAGAIDAEIAGVAREVEGEDARIAVKRTQYRRMLENRRRMVDAGMHNIGERLPGFQANAVRRREDAQRAVLQARNRLGEYEAQIGAVGTDLASLRRDVASVGTGIVDGDLTRRRTEVLAQITAEQERLRLADGQLRAAIAAVPAGDLNDLSSAVLQGHIDRISGMNTADATLTGDKDTTLANLRAAKERVDATDAYIARVDAIENTWHALMSAADTNALMERVRAIGRENVLPRGVQHGDGAILSLGREYQRLQTTDAFIAQLDAISEDGLGDKSVADIQALIASVPAVPANGSIFEHGVESHTAKMARLNQALADAQATAAAAVVGGGGELPPAARALSLDEQASLAAIRVIATQSLDRVTFADMRPKFEQVHGFNPEGLSAEVSAEVGAAKVGAFNALNNALSQRMRSVTGSLGTITIEKCERALGNLRDPFPGESDGARSDRVALVGTLTGILPRLTLEAINPDQAGLTIEQLYDLLRAAEAVRMPPSDDGSINALRLAKIAQVNAKIQQSWGIRILSEGRHSLLEPSERVGKHVWKHFFGTDAQHPILALKYNNTGQPTIGDVKDALNSCYKPAQGGRPQINTGNRDILVILYKIAEGMQSSKPYTGSIPSGATKYDVVNTCALLRAAGIQYLVTGCPT